MLPVVGELVLRHALELGFLSLGPWSHFGLESLAVAVQLLEEDKSRPVILNNRVRVLGGVECRRLELIEIGEEEIGVACALHRR